MTKLLYCWRCKMEIPMLEEHEWALVIPDMANTANAEFADTENRALARYYEITGFRETNINALWHHRVGLFGPPCQTCGKLLRTPRAKLSAECGTTR